MFDMRDGENENVSQKGKQENVLFRHKLQKF